jgi:hypothetical protein
LNTEKKEIETKKILKTNLFFRIYVFFEYGVATHAEIVLLDKSTEKEEILATRFFKLKGLENEVQIRELSFKISNSLKQVFNSIFFSKHSTTKDVIFQERLANAIHAELITALRSLQ